ncbi:hypothetical protein [Brevibacterium sediminis]
MGFHLVTEGAFRQSLDDDSPAVESASFPAVLFDGGGADLFGGFPVKVLDHGGEWVNVPDAVGHQWESLPAEVQGRLVREPSIELSTEDFNVLTRAEVGVSAGFFALSDDELEWRIAGPFKNFVELLSDIAGEDL